MKFLRTRLIFLALLFGCSSAPHFTDIPMRSVGPDSRVGVRPTDSGFQIRVQYTGTNRSFSSIIRTCEDELISLADQYAETFPRKIEPIERDRIRISMERNQGALNQNVCKATTTVRWAAEK